MQLVSSYILVQQMVEDCCNNINMHLTTYIRNYIMGYSAFLVDLITKGEASSEEKVNIIV